MFNDMDVFWIWHICFIYMPASSLTRLTPCQIRAPSFTTKVPYASTNAGGDLEEKGRCFSTCPFSWLNGFISLFRSVDKKKFPNMEHFSFLCE
jgi:hypothetical protein